MPKEALIEIEEMTPEQIEEEAVAYGWTPQEQFKGNPEKWVPAEEFVQRGRKLVPILNANNKRLQRDVLTANQKVDTLSQQLAAAQTAIEKLEKHYTESNKRQLAEQREALLGRLEEAREASNVRDERTIQKQLDEIDQAEAEAEADANKGRNPPASTPNQPNVDPALVEWQQENTWFGQDKKKTKLFTRLAEDIREEGTDLKGREFLDHVLEKYEETYGESEEEDSNKPPQRRTPSKVEGAPRARANASNAKSWEALPADAKQACLGDADDLVGPNKRYKTLDEWKKRYVEIYFGE